MNYIVINSQTGNGMYAGTKGPTEYDTSADAQRDADERNERAKELGTETRYEVRKA